MISPHTLNIASLVSALGSVSLALAASLLSSLWLVALSLPLAMAAAFIRIGTRRRHKAKRETPDPELVAH